MSDPIEGATLSLTAINVIYVIIWCFAYIYYLCDLFLWILTRCVGTHLAVAVSSKRKQLGVAIFLPEDSGGRSLYYYTTFTA